MELSLLLQASSIELLERVQQQIDSVDQNVVAAAFDSRQLKFDELWRVRLSLLEHDDLAILVRDIGRFAVSFALVGEVEPAPADDGTSGSGGATSRLGRQNDLQVIREYYPILSDEAKRRVLQYTDIPLVSDAELVVQYVDQYEYDEPIRVIAQRIDRAVHSAEIAWPIL